MRGPGLSRGRRAREAVAHEKWSNGSERHGRAERAKAIHESRLTRRDDPAMLRSNLQWNQCGQAGRAVI